MSDHQTVLILDFGSQFSQLIARRVRENRVYREVHPFDLPLDEVRRRNAVGLILAGGPASVDEPGPPKPPQPLFALGIPSRAIGTGMMVRRNAWAAPSKDRATASTGGPRWSSWSLGACPRDCPSARRSG